VSALRSARERGVDIIVLDVRRVSKDDLSHTVRWCAGQILPDSASSITLRVAPSDTAEDMGAIVTMSIDGQTARTLAVGSVHESRSSSRRDV
jgi:hypothetical protein